MSMPLNCSFIVRSHWRPCLTVANKQTNSNNLDEKKREFVMLMMIVF